MAPTPESTFDGLILLEEVWTIVNENYARDDFNGVDWLAVRDRYEPLVRDAETHEAVIELLSAMVGQLRDGHSRLLAPEAEATLYSGHDAPGTGIIPYLYPYGDDSLVVWRVCHQSPAAAAGLKPGTRLHAINGTAIGSMSRQELSRVISEIPFAERWEYRLQRSPSDPVEELVIPAGPVDDCPGWEHQLFGDGLRIGYVRIPTGAPDLIPRLVEVMTSWEREGALDGLIVDVRQNRGGFGPDQAVGFFANGRFARTLSLRPGSGGTTRFLTARGPAWNDSTPIVVLMDEATGSAAEIFALGMRALDRAVLIGTTSAGNLGEFRTFVLSDGSLLMLETEIWGSLNGEIYEGAGLEPDIFVPLGEWSLTEWPDPQVQAAIDYLVTQDRE
jgi:carboxyl-terminal processing protease